MKGIVMKWWSYEEGNLTFPIFIKADEIKENCTYSWKGGSI
jgi:hypothetical protein